MSDRRRFLAGASLLGAAGFAAVSPNQATAQAGRAKPSYLRPGGVGRWEANKKYTMHNGPRTVYARVEAKNAGERAQILGLLYGSVTFTVASASVSVDEDGATGLPHNSFSMSVPEGASFQVKLEGNVAPENVHISVFG